MSNTKTDQETTRQLERIYHFIRPYFYTFELIYNLFFDLEKISNEVHYY